MTSETFDGANRQRIAALAEKVIAGNKITKTEGQWLFQIEATADIYELIYWANQIRMHCKGDKIRLCSIVNIKAGGCPEDCKFCAQSVRYQTPAPQHGLVDEAALLKAAEEAQANHVHALGLVAAWARLKEGPLLDELCEKFELLKRHGRVSVHASLGMIYTQRVADRLKAAGVECYNHNLETAPGFFPQICTTHTYADRLQTIKHLKAAGIQICSGGIIGLGETRADRCELAFELREVAPDVVPINILNPIKGTPLQSTTPPSPLEVLKTIACFRFILPEQEITIAGGRAVNLRDLQSLVFMAGASALMVGNYLTTPNRPIEHDMQMLRDLALVPC